MFAVAEPGGVRPPEASALVPEPEPPKLFLPVFVSDTSDQAEPLY